MKISIEERAERKGKKKEVEERFKFGLMIIGGGSGNFNFVSFEGVKEKDKGKLSKDWDFFPFFLFFRDG